MLTPIPMTTGGGLKRKITMTPIPMTTGGGLKRKITMATKQAEKNLHETEPNEPTPAQLVHCADEWSL